MYMTLRRCAILGNLCDAIFFMDKYFFGTCNNYSRNCMWSQKFLVFPTFSNLNTYHLYTVDVFQDRWITLEYVTFCEIVPPRRVIFLVSSNHMLSSYTCVNNLMFKSSKAVALKKRITKQNKYLSNVLSLFKTMKNV